MRDQDQGRVNHVYKLKRDGAAEKQGDPNKTQSWRCEWMRSKAQARRLT